MKKNPSKVWLNQLRGAHDRRVQRNKNPSKVSLNPSKVSLNPSKVSLKSAKFFVIKGIFPLILNNKMRGTLPYVARPPECIFKYGA
jgi:hypothetical protein